MRYRRYFVGSLLVASVASAQSGTDFSGQWALVESENADPGLASSMLVTQPVTRTSVDGTPMPPTYLFLTVERTVGRESRTDRYLIGTDAGVVGGVAAGAPADRPVPLTRISTRWDERRLVIETRAYQDARRDSEPDTERVEIWQLESESTLRVTLVVRRAGLVVTDVAARYRRN